MQWSEIRQAYPDQWLVIEALDAHTTPDSRRHLDRVAVVEKYPDGSTAMRGCHQFYRECPSREFYFVHTSRQEVDIRERRWLGIRGDHEVEAQV